MTYFSKQENSSDSVIALIPVRESEFEAWLKGAGAAHVAWTAANGFKAKPGEICMLPAAENDAGQCVFGMQKEGWLGQLSSMTGKLPEGDYQLRCDWTREQRLQASLGWGLDLYRFNRYKKNPVPGTRLMLDSDIENDVRTLCQAQNLVRDLVNTPTEHMGPQQLEDVVVSEAERHHAKSHSHCGPGPADA